MTFNAEFEVFVSLPCQAQSGLAETAERCQDDLSTRHAQRHKTQTVRMYLCVSTYVSATVSGYLPRTSWPTGCTWFFMRLHIKNDGIPAARPGRCFACLMTTKTKPKNVERKTNEQQEKNGTENNKLLCGCWTSYLLLSFSLSLYFYVSLCLICSLPSSARPHLRLINN